MRLIQVLVFCLFGFSAQGRVIEFGGGEKLGLANHTIRFSVQHPLRPLSGELTDCTGLLQVGAGLKQGVATDILCDATKLEPSYAPSMEWLLRTMGKTLRYYAGQSEVLTTPVPGDPFFKVIMKGELKLKTRRIPQDFELRCIREAGSVVICKLSGTLELTRAGIEPPEWLGMRADRHAVITGDVSFSRAALRGSRHRPGRDIQERWRILDRRGDRIKEKLKRIKKERKQLINKPLGTGGGK